MFKNSRLLKGIFLVMACVMVLGCAFLLRDFVAAKTNVVTLYVSDHGDNTDGSDEACAFTSLDAAFTAVNEKKYPAGTELKLVVVDRLTVGGQKMDSVIATDADGGRMPVTITSLETSSEDDYSELYLTYLHSNATSGNRAVGIYNDIFFKDVKITSKVHNVNVGYDVTREYFSVTTLLLAGHNVSFKNCVIRAEENEYSLQNYSKYVITIRCDGSGNNSVPVVKTVNFLGGDYTGNAVQAHYYTLPNVDLTVNIKNSKFEQFYPNAITKIDTDPDLKKMTINVGEGTEINKFYYMNTGDVTIPEGMTFNYYEGAKINIINAVNASKSSTLYTDLTHNFYGGEYLDVHTAPKGKTVGNIYTNVYGGYIDELYCGSEVGTATVEGTMVNTFYGGTVYSYAGGGRDNSVHTGDIINTVYDGATFTGAFVGGALKASCQNITNNIYGGTFTEACDFYGGSGDGTVNGTITTNIYGGKFLKNYYGGNRKGVSGNITNNISKARITVYYGGNAAGATSGNIVNRITSATITGMYTGGNKGATACGTIENTLKKVTLGNHWYGGNGAGPCQSITNTLEEVTLADNSKWMFGGNDGRNATVEAPAPVNGDITNNFISGTFPIIVGGCRLDSVTGTVTNNIYGGSFLNTFMGGTGYDTRAGEIGNIVNNVYGGSFEKFVGATRHGMVAGSVNTTISGGIFNKDYYAGSEKDSACALVTTIKAGQFLGNVYGVSAGSNDNLVSAELKIATVKDAGSAVKSLYFAGTVVDSAIQNTVLEAGNGTIQISADTLIGLDAIQGTGVQMLSMKDNWETDKVYLTVDTPVNFSAFKIINANTSVLGSGVFDGSQVKGSAVQATLVAPFWAMTSYRMENNLNLRFWVEYDAVEDFITNNGYWAYYVSINGKDAAQGSFDSVQSLAASDVKTDGNGVRFVTFTTDLGISSIQYGKDIVVDMTGADTVTKTVYQLLEEGQETLLSAANPDVELANLLKAIHNYGTEAYRVFKGGTETSKYALPVPVVPQNLTDSTRSRGYFFHGTSLTLGEKVSLNYYFKAASDVTFQAINTVTGQAVDASKITVTPVTGNEDEYNMIISISLNVPEMKDTYELIVSTPDKQVASCVSSVPYNCAEYINPTDHVYSAYGDVARALLSYIDWSNAVLNRA